MNGDLKLVFRKVFNELSLSDFRWAFSNNWRRITQLEEQVTLVTWTVQGTDGGAKQMVIQLSLIRFEIDKCSLMSPSRFLSRFSNTIYISA